MATDPNKTVFISYRRSASRHLARSIFMDLTQHGYDVFLDVNTIDSGAFDSIILNQIGARTHFIILLSPTALKRCVNDNDWLRLEIQEAMHLGRNIVPLIEEGFDFERETGYLPAEWRDQFRRLSGMRLLHDYFEEGMTKLRDRFLKPPQFSVELKTVSTQEQREVQQRIAQVTQQPTLPLPDTEAILLLRELDDINTPHFRRLEIGQRLAQIGDPRPHIGVLPNGVPDIGWCLVEKGGEITIKDVNFTIKPFYVAKYLTTNAHYQAFVDAKDGYNNPEWWKLFPEKYRPQKLNNLRNPNSNSPRDTLSWYQSMAFAQWLDTQYRQKGLFQSVLNLNSAEWKISLPPEWYWQWMAQNGAEAREYPWGAWDNNSPRANTTEASINDQSTSVGMYPHGIVGCGAYDVAGNLWEWCLNDYSAIATVNGYSNGVSKVLRGGAFNLSQDLARVASRSNDFPNYVFNFYGCRVVLLPIVS